MEETRADCIPPVCTHRNSSSRGSRGRAEGPRQADSRREEWQGGVEVWREEKQSGE